MSEVHDMYDTLINALKTLDENTKTLKTNIEHLDKHNDFKGKTAESIKNYNKSFHIETINRIGNIKKEFEKSFSKSIESFHSDVDTSHSAVLDDESIKTYKDDIKKAANNIEQTRIRMNSNLSSVTDITSAKTIVSTDVKDKNDEFKKHINETLRNFDDFQSSHNLDEVDLLALISPVATLTSKVINMPANRAKISTSSTLISNQYQLYSENNQIAQLKKELEKYQNAVYGGGDVSKYVKGALQLKNYLLAAYIAGDGDFIKGNNLFTSGKMVATLGKSKIKLINSVLNTNLENVEGKRIAKAIGFINDKSKNLPMSNKLEIAMKMTLNYNDTTLKNLDKITGKPSLKKIGQSFKTGFLDNLKESTGLNLLIDKDGVKSALSKELKDFKSKNFLGKGLKSLKYFSKGLGPVGGLIAVGSNFANEKSAQKRIVGSAVDLGAMAASTGTGMAVGTAIGGPVGAGVGLVVGFGVGLATEAKVFDGNKSLTDITKDTINSKISSIRNSGVVKKTENFFSNSSIGSSLSKIF